MTERRLKNINSISGHSGAIYDVIYNQSFLYTSSADRFVVKWDAKTGEQTNFAVKLEEPAYNIAFSETFNILAVGTNNGGIHVIDTEKRAEVRLLKQHKSAIFALTNNPLKNHFYSGDKDGMLCVWNAQNFELLITLPFNCGKIREISIDEKGDHMVICGQDGYIRILETSFFNVIHEFKAHNDGVNCALFDEEVLFTGGKDAYIHKWNWKKEAKLASVPAHNYAIYDLEFINNKENLVSVSFDKSIKLWNKADVSIIERIEFKNKGHRHTVNRLAKINENKIATISDDRLLKIWELTD